MTDGSILKAQLAKPQPHVCPLCYGDIVIKMGTICDNCYLLILSDNPDCSDHDLSKKPALEKRLRKLLPKLPHKERQEYEHALAAFECRTIDSRPIKV